MQPAGKLPCAECAADFSFEGGREKERVRELGSSRMFVEETSREWSLTAAAPFDKNSKKTEDNPPLKGIVSMHLRDTKLDTQKIDLNIKSQKIL
jgi:hypothetical protein